MATKAKTKRVGRGSKSSSAGKRRTVAQGIVAGKSTRAIAKEAKCSQRHVQRLAAEKPTQFLIAEMMRPHRAKLEKLATKAITAIEKALAAKKKGDPADHKSRLWAVDRYRELLELAQGGKPQDKPPDAGPQFTWEEFVVLYRSRKETVDGQSAREEPAGGDR